VIDTLRGLLLGTAIGDSAAITLASYLWARKLYNRDPIR
jgi:ABC-2 type transport system permease protein